MTESETTEAWNLELESLIARKNDIGKMADAIVKRGWEIAYDSGRKLFGEGDVIFVDVEDVNAYGLYPYVLKKAEESNLTSEVIISVRLANPASREIHLGFRLRCACDPKSAD